jgi:hypothetical protein
MKTTRPTRPTRPKPIHETWWIGVRHGTPCWATLGIRKRDVVTIIQQCEYAAPAWRIAKLIVKEAP